MQLPDDNPEDLQTLPSDFLEQVNNWSNPDSWLYLDSCWDEAQRTDPFSESNARYVLELQLWKLKRLIDLVKRHYPHLHHHLKRFGYVRSFGFAQTVLSRGLRENLTVDAPWHVRNARAFAEVEQGIIATPTAPAPPKRKPNTRSTQDG